MNKLATSKRTAVIAALVEGNSINDRGIGTANFFMQDVAGRISNRVQLTTDGHMKPGDRRGVH